MPNIAFVYFIRSEISGSMNLPFWLLEPFTTPKFYMGTTSKTTWNVKFLQGHFSDEHYALIILNQPFSRALLRRLWASTQWHCCADGGANRLFDTLQNDSDRRK